MVRSCKKVNQLLMGIKVESEHKPTYKFLQAYIKKHGRMPSQKEFYALIAKNHIDEDRKYYTKLSALDL